MPELVRLYFRHVSIGFCLGLGFTGLLLWMNVANLWHLVVTSDLGLLATGLLAFFNAIVFGGVQFAIAVMNLAQNDRPGPGPGQPVPSMHPVAVKGGGNRSDRAGVNFPRA